MLAEAGIHSLDDLCAIGAVEAFEAVREHRPEVSLNLLWALQGAIDDVDCRTLSQETKQRLKGDLRGPV